LGEGHHMLLSEEETDPESPIHFWNQIEEPPDKLPLSTKIMLAVIVACILTLLGLIVWSGGAIMGA